uniref:CPW-WPC domain-containing protein n=1 Tax=viral metagenome TaxID=1070528 RepID=A0A6C0I5E1_9ZZZZ
MDSDQGSFLSRINFQRIVIIIAIIMLIGAMVFIGYALYRQSSDVSWPPKTPKCPDYWTVTANGNCTMPTGSRWTGTNCEYNGVPGGTQGMPTCPTSSTS